jgi:hypothetical protein
MRENCYVTERGTDVEIRRNMRAMWARWIGIVIMFAVMGSGLSLAGSEKAHAAKQPLDIAIEHGFDGKMKDGRWFPVKMTITNPGDDVSGDLTVRMAGDNGKTIAYAKHVDLPRQSTKIVWFTLPGKNLNASNNVVTFYDKSVDEGEPILFSQGNVSIETRPVSQDTLMVGIVARDPDTLNFLSLLNQKGYPLQLTPLALGDFPWESAMLDGLDVIAFNDSSTDILKPEQVKEIQAWVERGGRLVLAGGAGFAKTASVFASISPVTAAGTASVSVLTEFVQATGKELALNGPFTVSKATVKSGETLFSENGIPLVVNAPYGQGATTYVAYDLALQPVASWSGNAALWERILFGAVSPAAGGQRYGAQNGLWELNNALEVFPQLIPPAYGLLTLLFLAYAILVAPAMYVVLKKMDKREWAWFAIPSVAIVTSLIIYGIGASGRGSTLAQTLGINELSGTGTASRMAASSVFVPRGGSYELEWNGKRNISPLTVNDGRQLQAGDAEMIIRSEADKTVAAFAHVPFWSVRKAFAAQESVNDAGKFDYTIRFDASGAKGEVTNNTKTELYEAGLIFGGQWYRLGDMKPGEKKQFQASIGGSVGMKDPQWGNLIFPYSGNQDMMQRERSLLNSFSQSNWNGQMNSQRLEPYILGFAKTSGNVFKIDGKDVQSERIDLYVQQMKPDYAQNGNVYIPAGVIVPFTEASNVTHMSSHYNGGVEMGSGDMTILYRLPDRADWRYEKLTLAMAGQQQFKIELWNEKKQAWSVLQGAQAELNADQIKEALTGGNGIRLKVTNSQNNGRFTYPALSAEGAVKKQ